MEVSYSQAVLDPISNSNTGHNADLTVMDNMDVDMEIDLGPIDDLGLTQYVRGKL